MKLGISTSLTHSSPEEWALLHKENGLDSVVFPLNYDNPVSMIDNYVKAAKDADLCIAEVGSWCNPISPDNDERKQSIEKCIRQLELAEYIGAECCVNISGAAGKVWDGSYKENYSEKTYSEIIESVQTIIDAVNPQKTFYTLEPMSHMLPDSPEVYLKMMKDIERPAFGVHLDIVNMITSPRVYYNNRELTDRCFSLLSPYIKSCHLKDAVIDHSLTVLIKEAVCGEGEIDLLYYIKKADELSSDMPMIIEHLPAKEAYLNSVKYIKNLYRGNNNEQ